MLIESSDFNLPTCPHDMALCMLKLQPTRMTLALAAAFSVSAAQADDIAPQALTTVPAAQGQTHVTADHMDGQMQDKLKANGLPDSMMEHAKERTQQIREAYEFLSERRGIH